MKTEFMKSFIKDIKRLGKDEKLWTASGTSFSR
jgi:hypothetical protein